MRYKSHYLTRLNGHYLSFEEADLFSGSEAERYQTDLCNDEFAHSIIEYCGSASILAQLTSRWQKEGQVATEGGIPSLETQSGLVPPEYVEFVLTQIELETGARIGAQAANCLGCSANRFYYYCDKYGFNRRRKS